MLDIGWTEMAVIAFVALMVIGPKDLPKAMRGVAKWVRKARSLSREFQSGLDEMMRETELDEAKKSIESVRRYRVDDLVEKEVDPTGTVKRDLKEIDDEARDRRTPSPAAANGVAPEAVPGPAGASGNGSAGEAAGGKGRTVTHAAQVAPGNSVKPPAAAGATSESGGAKPAPAKAAGAKSATAKKAAGEAASAKPAAKSGAAKSAPRSDTPKSGAPKSGTAKAAAPKSSGAKSSGAKSSGAKSSGTKSQGAKSPGAAGSGSGAGE